MRIAITGATGFLGRYLVRQFAEAGHRLRCWHRPDSDRGGFEKQADAIEWLPGSLGDQAAVRELVRGADAVVHAAVQWEGPRNRGAGRHGATEVFFQRPRHRRFDFKRGEESIGAQQRGRRNRIGLGWRSHGAVLAAKSIVSAGNYGKPHRTGATTVRRTGGTAMHWTVPDLAVFILDIQIVPLCCAAFRI